MNKKSSSIPNLLLIFLVFPIAAFAHSVRRIHIKVHFWIVLLFAIFFSYTFIPIPDSDATRYEVRFSQLDDYSFNEYLDDLNGMYNGKSEFQDAYVYTIQLLVSPFTSDIRIYRLVLGFIYFYTFLSLVRYVIFNNPSQSNRFNWFSVGFIFLISFSAGINGIRWPLALMVFLLGSYRYIVTGKYKFIILVSLSFLIHFSFILSIFAFFAFISTRRFFNSRISKLLVLSTLFYSAFFASKMSSNLATLGDGVEQKAKGYTENETYKEGRMEGFKRTNWYVQLHRTVPFNFVLLALVITSYFSFSLIYSKLVSELQFFAILNFMISYLSAQIIDPTSNRFAIVSVAVGFIYLYHLYQDNPNNRTINLLRYLYVPIGILCILVVLRTESYCVSPNLVIGNIFTEMYYRFDESIKELVGL